MKVILTGLLLVIAIQASAGPRLYVFDCGELNVDSLAMFGLEENESSVKQLFVPCYLVQHEQGLLFWEGGLPRTIADAEGAVAIEAGTLFYERWITEQLSDMGITPADVTYAAYSHLHFDHAGAANDFARSEVIMQQKEWDAAFGEGAAFVDTSLFDGLRDSKIRFIDGDHDVFGDGSVRLVFAPGHTAGHQVLLVSLDNSGQILLSGDLYHTRANRTLRRAPTFNVDAEQTLVSMDRIEQLLEQTNAVLWIEHDKALADTLKMAPLYYD